MSVKKGIAFKATILLGVFALALGFFFSQHLQKNSISSQFNGTYLETPRTIKSFNFTGIDQKSFTNTSLQGKWTLVFFGFTQCGYLCPTTMAELAKMYRILEAKNVKQLPQVVMVTIDPERDSLDRLAHYVTSFHPSFYGARGDEAVTQMMTKELGIAYAKIIGKDTQNYDVQHTGAIMLFNPKGELNAFFTTPHHAELIAQDYSLLIS